MLVKCIFSSALWNICKINHFVFCLINLHQASCFRCEEAPVICIKRLYGLWCLQMFYKNCHKLLVRFLVDLFFYCFQALWVVKVFFFFAFFCHNFMSWCQKHNNLLDLCLWNKKNKNSFMGCAVVQVLYSTEHTLFHSSLPAHCTTLEPARI